MMMMMMMFQQEIKWGWTASVSSSLLQSQLLPPNHDVTIEREREGETPFFFQHFD